MASFTEIQEEIAAMLSLSDEELSDEQRSTMDAYLDELAGQEADKIDGFAQFIKIQSSLAEACKQEAQRPASKARAAENHIAWLKGRYLAIMIAHGLKKVQGNAYTLSTRQSEFVHVLDTEANLAAIKAVNPDCVRTTVTVKPDKTVIRDMLKQGIELPGCELGKSVSLQIR